MDRITRKEMKHDEFVDGTMRLLRVIEENPRPLLWSAAAILVLVLAVSGIWTFLNSRRDAAADLLSRGEAAYFAPVAEDGSARPDDAYRPSFPSEQARTEATLSRLEKAADGFGPGAKLAGYLEGAVLLEAGKPDQAVEKLQGALEALGSDPTLGGPVKSLLATALEQTGQGERALELRAELADEGSGYPRDLALFALGRSQQQAGQTDKARETLQEIVDLYPESPMVSRAKEILELI